MYKSRSIKKYGYKQQKNKPHPAFIQEVNLHTVPISSPALYKYVISMDGKKFFLVSSQSSQKAIEISMDIGANPDPRTNPPPSPGKPRPKSGYKVPNNKFSYYRRKKKKKSTIIPISKDYAMRLVNEQIKTCSPRSAKRGRFANFSADESPRR